MKTISKGFFCLFTAFCLIFLGIVFLGKNSVKAKQNRIVFQKSTSNYQSFAALPKTFEGYLTVEAQVNDARPFILKKFLRNSVLEPYYSYMVRVADDNQIEFNIAPAIAMCESNLGKNIPAESYNAWGYGIPTGAKSGTMFEGWEHSIRREIELLRKFKNNIGLTEMQSLESLMRLGAVYAPPSVANGHSWAHCVSQFMQEMQ